MDRRTYIPLPTLQRPGQPVVPLERVGRIGPPRDLRALAVLRLWREGRNTAEIAAELNAPERLVHRALCLARESQPIPFALLNPGLPPQEHATDSRPLALVMPLGLTVAERVRRWKAILADRYGVSVPEVMGGGRAQSVVSARHEVMAVMRRQLGWSLPRIGSSLGDRDHTTVLHACRRVEKEREARLEAAIAAMARPLVAQGVAPETIGTLDIPVLSELPTTRDIKAVLGLALAA